MVEIVEMIRVSLIFLIVRSYQTVVFLCPLLDPQRKNGPLSPLVSASIYTILSINLGQSVEIHAREGKRENLSRVEVIEGQTTTQDSDFEPHLLCVVMIFQVSDFQFLLPHLTLAQFKFYRGFEFILSLQYRFMLLIVILFNHPASVNQFC